MKIPFFAAFATLCFGSTLAHAQDSVVVKYDPSKDQFSGDTGANRVYSGQPMPMKLCAVGGFVQISLWSPAQPAWRTFRLSLGECMFSASAAITLKKSPGSLKMTVLPNVNAASTVAQ